MLMIWNKMVRYNMKKTFTITPFSNVGDIKFDSNREVVRKQLGKFVEFRKTRFSRNTTDDFGGFHVFYSVDNTVDAVELFPIETIVIFGGQNLFTLNRNELVEIFSDTKLKEEDGYLSFESFGVEISMEDNIVTSILVHKRNY